MSEREKKVHGSRVVVASISHPFSLGLLRPKFSRQLLVSSLIFGSRRAMVAHTEDSVHHVVSFRLCKEGFRSSLVGREMEWDQEEQGGSSRERSSSFGYGFELCGYQMVRSILVVFASMVQCGF